MWVHWPVTTTFCAVVWSHRNPPLYQITRMSPVFSVSGYTHAASVTVVRSSGVMSTTARWCSDAPSNSRDILRLLAVDFGALRRPSHVVGQPHPVVRQRVHPERLPAH